MKRYLYIIAAIIALVSCVREDFPVTEHNDVPEGYVRVEFSVNITDPTMVNTRAVDPDGLDVNNLTLFCFNEFGLYISSETATIKSHTSVDGVSDRGTFTAVIPNHTQIIHFLANHSEGLYDETDFPGQTESMVVANMEGGSGMLVYWSRFQMDTSIEKSITEQLQDLSYIVGTEYQGVKLIRNQAKITIDEWETKHFVVTGFRTVNIPAFGTVAPHHPTDHFDIVDNWESLEEFVTLPNNQALMSDIVDINTKPEDYIFETENTGDRLVSVIIRGHAPGQTESEDKYYRVVMQNDDGESFMIRRNHNYNLHITGMLTYGQNSFEEALTAPASNNAWISIDEWVNEITDGIQTLWVDQTSYVLSSDIYAGTDWTFNYRYTVNGSGDSVAPTVTWIDNNVAYDNITNNYNTSTGEGTVTLRFYPMYDGNEVQSGSVMIKHGKLQRKVTFYIIRTQHFTPSWISSQVYGDAREHVTLMFTIPETCPDALFPFTVLVSANHLDVRDDSGQQFPVYIKGEEGYFGQDWEGINYKYAYTVTGPGKHRLHMQSILKHEEDDTEEVHLEADFFETITKSVIFKGYGSDHRRIFLENLHNYGSQYAQDEELYYMLVPQKKAAPVVFTIALQERDANGDYIALDHNADPGSDQWHKNGADEILIYTKTLTMYDEYFADNPDHYGEIKDDMWEGEVTLINQESWSTNGRVVAFRTLAYPDENKVYPPGEEEFHYGMQSDGTYHIYMLTNSSYNKDVVRVSSNNSLSMPVFAKDRKGIQYTELYQGNEYRSVIFDIAHYRPYRFAPQIRVSDIDGSNPVYIPESESLLSNEVHSSTEENTDQVVLSYKPGQRVDFLFDITSFKGSDGRSVHPFGEMFGESFDVYIDAPMLDIDYSRIPDSWLAANNPALSTDKLRKDSKVPGRFIYTVDRYRDQERELTADMYEKTGETLTVHNKDVSTSCFDKYGVIQSNQTIDQSYERKLLPFRKNSITVGGDIHISTDNDKIVFWDKTFKMETQNITGYIQFQKADGTLADIPEDAFVAFVRMRTGARIGVVTITEDGHFSLNLRDEYQFSWEDDPIDFYYTADGVTYNFNYKDSDGNPQSVDLALLYQISSQSSQENPIILTVQGSDN